MHKRFVLFWMLLGVVIVATVILFTQKTPPAPISIFLQKVAAPAPPQFKTIPAHAVPPKENLPLIPRLHLRPPEIFPRLGRSLVKVDRIRVFKKARVLKAYFRDKLVKTYRIALGFSPVGHKEQEGDGKTPEGHYRISYKNPKSQFHLSLRVSYPSRKDLQNATHKGVSPGKDIMIHGLGPSLGHLGARHRLQDWTWGCIALTNQEITELYHATPLGTPIDIFP